MLSLSFSNTIFRFYLMMLVAIVAVLTQQAWMILLVYAVAVSAILGYRINIPRRKKKTTKRIKMEPLPRKRRKAV